MQHSKKLFPDRIVIHARDVANMTGQSERAARWLLQRLRESAGKEPHHLVSIEEFCAFTGLSQDEVRGFLT